MYNIGFVKVTQTKKKNVYSMLIMAWLGCRGRASPPLNNCNGKDKWDEKFEYGFYDGKYQFFC